MNFKIILLTCLVMIASSTDGLPTKENVKDAVVKAEQNTHDHLSGTDHKATDHKGHNHGADGHRHTRSVSVDLEVAEQHYGAHGGHHYEGHHGGHYGGGSHYGGGGHHGGHYGGHHGGHYGGHHGGYHGGHFGGHH